MGGVSVLPETAVTTPSPTGEGVKHDAGKTSRAEILAEAARCVTVDRAATYGSAEDSFGAIAAIWSARLGVKIRADQVAIMLIDLKCVRAWGNPGHRDNWVDIAGYAACGGEIGVGK